MRAGRIVLVVVGTLLALAGVGVVVAGAGVAWAYGTQRDDAGFFTTGTVRLDTPTPALRSSKIDLGGEPGPGDWVLDDHDLATVRITATPTPDRERAVFVGIGPQGDVDAYLAGVAHDQIADIDLTDRTASYRRSDGTATPAAPTTQTFWAAQVSGTATQTLDWDVRAGEWTLVAMNADGTPGVAIAATAGVKLDFLNALMIGLLVGGVVVLALGVVLIILGAAGAHRATPRVHPGAVPAPAGSPLRLEGRLDEPLSRWLWLLKWLLALPHFIILAFLYVAFIVVTVIAGIAILITGRYPPRLFTFNVGVLRWAWRVTYYATSAIATDRYPPFSLTTRDYPATLDVAYPDRLSRWQVLVKWWLLAIPHYLIIGFFTGSAWWIGTQDDNGWNLGLGGGLIGVLVLIAGVALLFTGRYPPGVYDLVMGLNRWIYRVIVYAALMTDHYPPFRLDTGSDEPPEPPTPTPTRPAAEAYAAPAAVAPPPG